MTARTLSLAIDRLEPGAVLALPPSPARAIYLAEGRVRVAQPDAAAALAANDAWHGTGATRVTVVEAAMLLRWELGPEGAPAGAIEGAGATTPALAAALDLDPAREWLLRCDRVDFPPGGLALRHTHQGAGIRCLLAGSFRVETGGHVLDLAPLGAWFEAGPEPVFARAGAEGPAAFARVMILPRELLGRSSIRYVDPADQAKPKDQRYQVFIDQPIAI
jgi:hypothetical protein